MSTGPESPVDEPQIRLYNGLMLKMKLAVNYPFIKSVKDIPVRAQRQLRIELQTTVKPVLQKQVDRTFGRDPGPVKKPIDWTSVRQRAAYFASNGFAAGIPYTRTDSLRTSWIVEISAYVRGSFIRLRNPKSYAKYVYPGAHQQGFHVATGWGRDFDRYTREFERTADVETANAWTRAIDYAIRTMH